MQVLAGDLKNNSKRSRKSGAYIPGDFSDPAEKVIRAAFFFAAAKAGKFL